MEMKFKNESGKDTTVILRKSVYRNSGGLYLGAYTINEEGQLEPYCNITINANLALDEGWAYINKNNTDLALLQAITDAGYITTTVGIWSNYPLVCFSKQFLDSIEELV